MRFIPVIFCLALVSLIETTMQAKVVKPKPNLVQSQAFKSPKHKLPEERRKLSLFPKSKKKFVVSEEPPSKVVTHSPAVLRSKKPLMKKIILQDKKPNTWNAIENETKRTEITKNVFTNNLSSIQKLEAVLISEEVSMEKENEHKESNEIRKDNKVADNIVQTYNIEFTTKASKVTTKDYLNLKDFMLTPRNDPVEIVQENKSDRSSSDSIHDNKNSKEFEKADLEEFIFLDPLPKTTESVIISSESSEEFFTTDIPEEPIILRRRRSSNIIEEENLAPTVAGHKYTQKDTKLDNNMAFKNIHS